VAITTDIDTSGFTARLNELHFRFGIPANRILEQETKRMVKTLLRFTPPSGGQTRYNAFGDSLPSEAGESVSAREQGRRAVASDLRNIFEFADDTYADFVDSLDKTPGPEVSVTYLSRSKVKKIVDWKHVGRTLDEVRAFHLRKRSKVTGRTPRTKARDGSNIGVWKVQEKMVLRKSLFSAYLKEVQSHVGNMKAGWTAAARTVSLAVPQWISSKFSGNGYGLSSLSGSRPSITINNSSTGIARQVDNVAKSALRVRGEAIAKNIKRMVKYGPGKQANYGY
jgi:hypothetical protein